MPDAAVTVVEAEEMLDRQGYGGCCRSSKVIFPGAPAHAAKLRGDLAFLLLRHQPSLERLFPLRAVH